MSAVHRLLKSMSGSIGGQAAIGTVLFTTIGSVPYFFYDINGPPHTISADYEAATIELSKKRWMAPISHSPTTLITKEYLDEFYKNPNPIIFDEQDGGDLEFQITDEDKRLFQVYQTVIESDCDATQFQPKLDKMRKNGEITSFDIEFVKTLGEPYMNGATIASGEDPKITAFHNGEYGN